MRSRDELLRADDATREQLLAEMSAELTQLMAAEPEFTVGVDKLTAQLRSLGHDLYSFDSDGHWELFCPNWMKDTGPGIVVHFHPDDGVTVTWSNRTAR